MAMKRRRRRYTAKNRKNVYVPLPNPRRRRRAASRRRSVHRANPFGATKRRRYSRRMRRNPPDFLGFKFKDVAIAGGAVVVAPFIEKQLMALLPASMSGTKGGRWAVKIGTAVATGYAAKALLGREASRLAFIALGANLVADAVAEFAPQLTPASALRPVGYYPLRGPLGAGPTVFGALPAGPYTGITGTAGMPVRPGQDPFTPVF